VSLFVIYSLIKLLHTKYIQNGKNNLEKIKYIFYKLLIILKKGTFEMFKIIF
jgi:hypothetical protein